MGDWDELQPLGYCFNTNCPPLDVLKYFKDSVVLAIDFDANHHKPIKWIDPGISYLQKKYL